MLRNINFQDLRQKSWAAIDNRVRIITAGLGLHELRAVLRGDPPTEKPNCSTSVPGITRREAPSCPIHSAWDS
jgi:hypothetical protein